MINDTLYTNLQNFGLTQYEAKAYIALLGLGTSNAYKISKASGIPRTRIYDILDALTTRGIVMLEETNDNIKNYTALPASVFLEQARTKWSDTYKQIETDLTAIESQNKQPIYSSTVRGEQNILAFCRDLLHEAEEKVILSLWNPMYLELLPDLKKCQERSCSLSGVTFEVPTPLFSLDKHRHNKSHTSLDKKKWFILSVDSKKLLYGHSAEHNSTAFYTDDPTHIYLLEDYIFHDILVNRLLKKGDEEHIATQLIAEILSEMKIVF